MEKAAAQDSKRKAKRTERSAKKIAKAKQNAFASKTASRFTHASTSAPTEQKKKTTTTAKTNLKTKIKEKIEQLIKPEKELVFYYDRRQQIALAIFYAIIALIVCGLSEIVNVYPQCFDAALITALLITKILIIAAFILTLIVVIFKPTLAIVNKDGIKIDHNEMLSWDDITIAEEKYTSYITRRPLIALHVDPIAIKKYHLTFMQILCKNNVFTPFSIPMYAMTPHDAEAIRNAIKKHVKYVDNRN